MPEELQPLDLHGVARALGEHPFEVVRLLVMTGHSVEPVIPQARVEQIRTFGGIERWWDTVDLPEDDNRARSVVRGVLDALLQRDRIGDRTTRRENLFRGLPDADLQVAMQAVAILIEQGHLVQVRAPSGALVAIHPNWADAARALVARGQAPDELATLWEA